MLELVRWTRAARWRPGKDSKYPWGLLAFIAILFCYKYLCLQEKKMPVRSSNVLNRLFRKQCLWLRILLPRLVPTCTRFQWRIHDIVEEEGSVDEKCEANDL